MLFVIEVNTHLIMHQLRIRLLQVYYRLVEGFQLGIKFFFKDQDLGILLLSQFPQLAIELCSQFLSLRVVYFLHVQVFLFQLTPQSVCDSLPLLFLFQQLLDLFALLFILLHVPFQLLFLIVFGLFPLESFLFLLLLELCHLFHEHLLLDLIDLLLFLYLHLIHKLPTFLPQLLNLHHYLLVSALCRP